MSKAKPFCTVPFAEGFSGIDSAFRNCCTADPQIASLPGQTFTEWQQDSRLVKFKQRMYNGQWPSECYKCQIQEQASGESFRTAVNNSVVVNKNFEEWPSRWNLKFGNVCNLACWTCNEYSSSVIAQHKKIINILPENFVDPKNKFQTLWYTLEADVLKSYEYHDMVTLTLLGGEPMYSKTVSRFLSRLIDLNLQSRTRLEFHTNGTKINKKILVKNTWNYVCVFLSLDAIGKKSEWLRYGSKWSAIESNVNFFKSVSDYVEVHCTLSVLNINDLPALDKFCKSVDLPLKIVLLSSPEYMSILKWPGDKQVIADSDYLLDNGFAHYYDLIGNKADNTSIIQLRNYINQFNLIRGNLADYDPILARAILLD